MARYSKLLMSVALMVMVIASAWTAGAREPEAAADYPTRPIQIIAPANPGGGVDLSARILAKYLTPVLGSPVVVTNMAGAGGTIAQDHVLDSDPDGYTILYFHEAFVANRVQGLTNTTLRDDFATVGGAFVVETVSLFSKQFRTWDEMVAAAREREVLFGSEVGAAFQIAFNAMKAGLGLENLRFVDTGAVSPTVAAMEGDQIHIAMAPMGTIADSVAAGRLHILAFLSTKERSQFAPEVPTMVELGVDVYMPKFFFLAMHRDTPRERVEIFREALIKITQDPGFLEEARNAAFTGGYLSPEEVYAMEAANYEIMTAFSGR